jgi:serine/threonine protein kinase
MIDDDIECDPVEEVAAEFLDRCRDGDSPSIEDYAVRHPQLADTIRELFPTIEALEGVKRENQQAAARNATSKPLRLTELGDFKIIREIGRGGMGIVYEAEQRSLGRRVALKVLPKQSLLDPVQLRRFQREAQMAARLHHTNIVSLFGIGEHDGFHFLVMELIDGVSLQEVISHLQLLSGSRVKDVEEQAVNNIVDNTERPWDSKSEQAASWLLHSGTVSMPTVWKKASTPSVVGISNGEATLATEAVTPISRLDPFVQQKRTYWRNVARVGRDAAHALQHAAERGVLHRDIKPGNMLLDLQGNIWISDFGLAQALATNEISTTGSIAGTLNYIPPEGFSGRYNEQSDIYSLGLTLYELLTLKPAFNERTPAAVMKRIAKESFQPIPPRETDPTIPRDLATVVLKAINPDPGQRYKSASDLATDLEFFLENRPINARRTSFLERGWRWCKRNKALSSLATIAVTLLVLVSIVMTFSYLHEHRANLDVQAALLQKKIEHKRSEATLKVAINALDDIYHKFAPSQLHDAAESVQAGSAAANASPASFAQPVLSAETAAVLEGLLTFYDRLAEEAGDNLLVEEGATKTLGRIGDVHSQLGQRQQALDCYRSALETIKKLRDKFPDRPLWIAETARIHNELGRLYFARRKFRDAQQLHLAALEILASVVETADMPECFYERARAWYFLGRREPVSASRVAVEQIVRTNLAPSAELDDPRPLPPRESASPQQIEHLCMAADLLSDLPSKAADNAAYDLLIACCYRELGLSVDSPDSGSSYGDKAFELLTDLTERFPDDQHYRYELVELLRSDIYGVPHADEERDNLRQALRNAADHADFLIAQHPYVPQYAVARMHVFHKLGHFLTHQARDTTGKEKAALLGEAQIALLQAHDQAGLLTKWWPDTVSYHMWSVVVDGSLAQVLLDLGSREETVKALNLALIALDDLSNDDQLGQEVGSSLPDVYRALSELAERAEASELLDRFQAGADQSY